LTRRFSIGGGLAALAAMATVLRMEEFVEVVQMVRRRVQELLSR
jgi:hypothetical protein